MRQHRLRKKAAWEIAAEIGIPVSTVSRHLRAQGLGRLWRIEQAAHPPQRYEHAFPGSLFHVDAKRFGRIDGIGHALHGDRRRRSRGVGWEVVFVCVDDHSRVAYAEMHPSENAACATRFFRRALRWFESLGVRCEQVLTDNARCYASVGFTALFAAANVRPCFTRPYTPRTNGKAEQFIQTLQRRWAYRWAYPTSPSERPRSGPGSIAAIITGPTGRLARSRPSSGSEPHVSDLLGSHR